MGQLLEAESPDWWQIGPSRALGLYDLLRRRGIIVPAPSSLLLADFVSALALFLPLSLSLSLSRNGWKKPFCFCFVRPWILAPADPATVPDDSGGESARSMNADDLFRSEIPEAQLHPSESTTHRVSRRRFLKSRPRRKKQLSTCRRTRICHPQRCIASADDGDNPRNFIGLKFNICNSLSSFLGQPRDDSTELYQMGRISVDEISWLFFSIPFEYLSYVHFLCPRQPSFASSTSNLFTKHRHFDVKWHSIGNNHSNAIQREILLIISV